MNRKITRCKLLCIVMCVALIMSFVPISVYAAEEEEPYTGRYWYGLYNSQSENGFVSTNGTAWNSVNTGYNELNGAECIAYAKPVSGYKFKEWQDSDGTFVSDSAQYTFILKHDTFLFAVFEEAPDTSIVSFELNGHGKAILEQTIDKDCTASKPDDPSEDGWTFRGWYADSLLTTEFDFDSKITADTVVYAKWTEDAKEIRDVDIICEGYAIGKNIADAAPTTEREGVIISGWSWFDNDGNLLDNGTFEENTQYRIQIYLDAEENYMLAELEQKNVLFNGMAISYFINPTYGEEREFGEVQIYNYPDMLVDENKTNVNSVEIVCSGYELGLNIADAVPVTETAGVIISGYNWFDEDGNLLSEGTFEADTQYRVLVYLKAAKGYTLEALEQANVTFDGTNTTYFTNPCYGVDAEIGQAKIYHYPAELVKEKVFHTVSFEMNGHGKSLIEQLIEDGYKAVMPEKPSEDGWIFCGWYSDEELTTEFDFDATVTSDISLFAKWEKLDILIEKVSFEIEEPIIGGDSEEFKSISELKTYPENAARVIPESIAWYQDGSLCSTCTGAFEAGKDYYFTVCLEANDGFFFDFDEDYYYTGSVSINGCEIEIKAESSGTSILVTKKFSIEAIAHPEYRVSFEMNGHGNPVIEQMIEENNKAVMPEEPHDDDLSFEGWYSDEELTTIYDFESLVTSDITLYAKWTRNVKQISKIEITIESPVIGKKAEETVLIPELILDPSDSAKLLTDELHWYNSNGQGYYTGSFEEGIEYTYEIILFADAGYEFIGANGVFEGTVLVNGVEAYYAELNQNNTAAYIGFKLSPVSNPADESEVMVTFEMNGHGDKLLPQTVEKGSKVSKPAEPSEEGWIFGGWYGDKNLSTAFDFDAEVNADITVYAKWTKAPADEHQSGINTALVIAIAAVVVAGAAVFVIIFLNKKKKSKW